MKVFKFILVIGLVVLATFAAGCSRDEFFDTQEQLQIDTASIRTFLTNRSLLERAKLDTASNIYYLINEQGTGEKPTFGSTIITRYNGFLLTGEQFDTTDERGPFNFVLGRGDVIAGWDIGFALIEKGTSATFFIPSGLAYGTAGFQTIPPNAVLMFEVRLIDIR